MDFRERRARLERLERFISEKAAQRPEIPRNLTQTENSRRFKPGVEERMRRGFYPGDADALFSDFGAGVAQAVRKMVSLRDEMGNPATLHGMSALYRRFLRLESQGKLADKLETELQRRSW